MKSILILSMVISANLFASSTESFGETCFKATSEVPDELPSVICLTEAKLNLDSKQLSISTSTAGAPTRAAAYYLARKNENGFSFKAKSASENIHYSVCGTEINSQFDFSGVVDNDGLMPTTGLKIVLDYDITYDDCHLSAREYKVNYELVK